MPVTLHVQSSHTKYQTTKSINKIKYILLTWINLTPAWISNHILREAWDEITYPFKNVDGCSAYISEFNSTNDLLPQFKMDVITYPWWD